MKGYCLYFSYDRNSLTVISTSLLCIALGREAVFSSSMKHLPQSDKTIIGFMHPFFRILAEIQRLHQPGMSDFMELWRASCSLHERLGAFWSTEDSFQDSSENDGINMGTVCE